MFRLSILLKMLIERLRKAKKGATAIEYAIIASLLSVAIIIGVEATGVATANKYEYVATSLEQAFQPASGGANGGASGGSPNLQKNPDTP